MYIDEKEILLGYAKRGEPRSIWDAMCGYKWGDDEKGFEVNEEEAKRWGSALKKLAVEGNIIAQQIIAGYHSHRAWEDFSTGESEEQIADMQESFRSNIFSQADAGNTEAIISKAKLLYNHQNPKDGEEESWLAMLKAAAEAGSSLACDELYAYYEYGGFTLYRTGSSDSEAYELARTDHEKALYYLEKGVNCTDYYSYICKERVSDKYYNAILHVESPEQAKEYLESYKYWLHLAAESGSLEALEKEKTLESDIAQLYRLHPAFMKLASHQADNRTAAPAQGQKGGCYVATCVYGSYDCPEVWVLRRYRDNVLADTRQGRAFIRFYYWAGPKAVKLFGKTAWFHRLFKKPLDNMVEKLKNSGFADTPYCD